MFTDVLILFLVSFGLSNSSPLVLKILETLHHEISFKCSCIKKMDRKYIYSLPLLKQCMKKKNRFDTSKTMWHLFEWGTLCIVYDCGQVNLGVRTDDFIFLFYYVSRVHWKEQMFAIKRPFFEKRNVCELIYQYYRTESMCVYLEKIGNSFLVFRASV